MKTSIKLLIGIVLLLAFFCILAILQRVFVVAVGLAAIVAIVALVRYVMGEQPQKAETSNEILERRAHKNAEKALKELERRTPTERGTARGASADDPVQQVNRVGLFRK